jgi:hypothetical protein
MSSDSCRQIDSDHVKLYKDSECTELWTDNSKIVWQEPLANEFVMKVVKSRSSLQINAYVGETTLGLVKGCRHYQFEICGLETVSLKMTPLF